jgi:hypothetical protein
MIEPRLILDTKVTGRSGAGLVYTGLSLRGNGFAFPDPEWVDFAVVVLSWWTKATVNLLAERTKREEVRFMEGPYLIEVTVATRAKWQLRCIEAGESRRTCEYETMVEIGAFVAALLEAACAALHLCRERGWWTHDADILESGIAEIREEMRRLAI